MVRLVVKGCKSTEFGQSSLESSLDEFEGLDYVHVGQDLSKPVDQFEFLGVEEEFLASGQLVDSSRDGDVYVRRPNGVFVERHDAGRHRQLYYDGAHAALLDVGANLYAERTEDVPGDLDGFVDLLVEELNVNLPLADLVVADPYRSFTDPAVSGVDLGTARVRGETCHHLAFTNDAIEWQVFIAKDGPPLVRKVVIHYADEPGRPRWEAVLSDWDLDAEIPDERFAFTPPEGSHRITLVGFRSHGEEEEE